MDSHNNNGTNNGEPDANRIQGDFANPPAEEQGKVSIFQDRSEGSSSRSSCRNKDEQVIVEPNREGTGEAIGPSSLH